MSVGPLPPRPLDKGVPGPGFLAHLITSKYADALPLCRQQQIYRRHGLELPRSTLCGWVAYVADRGSDEAARVGVAQGAHGR